MSSFWMRPLFWVLLLVETVVAGVIAIAAGLLVMAILCSIYSLFIFL